MFFSFILERWEVKESLELLKEHVIEDLENKDLENKVLPTDTNSVLNYRFSVYTIIMFL